MDDKQKTLTNLLRQQELDMKTHTIKRCQQVQPLHALKSSSLVRVLNTTLVWLGWLQPQYFNIHVTAK
jgi:hypothetical protein